MLERGVVQVYPSKEELRRALEKDPSKLTFYLGVDPTASFLHLGHIVPVRKLEQLRMLGARVILLIGDFTATVGDPTDKLSARKVLTRQEVQSNAKNYIKLISPILKIKRGWFGKGAEIRRNNDWLGKMSLSDFMVAASEISRDRLDDREMFRERERQGLAIHLNEFVYPVLQGLDSVYMNVDGEVGGNDQTFNMLVGRTFMQRLMLKAGGLVKRSGNPTKEKFVISVKLLVDPEGKKMGKSEGNAVALDAKPNDMYGAVMSWPDGVVKDAFELLTDVEMDVVEKMSKDLSPRDFKANLALEITKIFHGESKAKGAEAEFNKVFQSHGIPEDIKTVKIDVDKLPAAELLVKLGLAASNSEARRVIEQGGMSIGDETITDPAQEINIKKGLIVRRGKRQFAKIA